MGNVGNIDGSYLMSACGLYLQDVKNKTMSVEQASFCLQKSYMQTLSNVRNCGLCVFYTQKMDIYITAGNKAMTKTRNKLDD